MKKIFLERKTKKRKKVSVYNRIIFSLGLIFFICVFLAVGAGITLYINMQKEIPSITDMFSYKPPTATIIYDDNNTKITELYIERRIPIKLKEIPQYAVNATIALEDQQFYEHWGINLYRFFVAVAKDILRFRLAQGASTITQQLARNMFLTMEKSMTRKIKEALITVNLEKNFSKEEILEMYFNQINYGGGLYGIEAASNMYLGKSARELTLAEAALLAAVPQIPEYYNLFRNYEGAKRRQEICLKNMLSLGYITKEEYDNAVKEKIVIRQKKKEEVLGSYFIEEVRKEVIKRYGYKTLYKGGLKIYTTMNSDMQKSMEDVISKQLKYYEKLYRKKDTKATYDSIVAANNDTLHPAPKYLQASMIIIDNDNGEVKALVGGRDFEDSEFNRAVQSRRQPGSIFKLFLFSAAIEDGTSPGDIIMDTPIVLNDGSDTPYKPHNYDEKFLGAISMRKALALSRNVTAIRLIKNIGPETVVNHAKKLGIESPLTPVLSLALGSSDVTLYEMTRAFSVYPNYGTLKTTTLIRYIEDDQGVIIYKADNMKKKVMDENVAYVVTDMLRSVALEGTAQGLKYYGIKSYVCGKTGTTNDYSDAWFVGFSKRYTAGVWVGYDILQPIGDKATGAVVALPIWANVMKPYINADTTAILPTKGISRVNICSETGMLPSKYCKYIRSEIYIKGREPKDICIKHKTGYVKDSEGISFENIDANKKDEL